MQVLVEPRLTNGNRGVRLRRMDNNQLTAQPVPPNGSARSGWEQGVERGFKSQMREVWDGLDELQKWSLYAVVALGILLILLVLGFGIRDLVVGI